MNLSNSTTKSPRKISSPWSSLSAKNSKPPSKTFCIDTPDFKITSTKENTTKSKSPPYLTSSKTKIKPANCSLKMFNGPMTKEPKKDSIYSGKKSPNKHKNKIRSAWNKTQAFSVVTRTAIVLIHSNSLRGYLKELKTRIHNFFNVWKIARDKSQKVSFYHKKK